MVREKAQTGLLVALVLLLAMVLSMLLAWLIPSLLFFLESFFLESGEAGGGITGWWRQRLLRPTGPLLLVLPSTISFLAVALFIASRQGAVAPSLGLVRGRLPAWFVLAAALVTPALTAPLELLLRLLGVGRGEQLQFMDQVVGGHQGVPGLAALLLVALLPAVSEELLFRGWAQRLLSGAWGPGWAIALVSVLFALAHGDPLHALLVLPAGIWFGLVAWWTRSTWPAIACHVINNLLAAGMSRVRMGTLAPWLDPVVAEGALLIMAVLAALSLLAARRPG